MINFPCIFKNHILFHAVFSAWKFVGTLLNSSPAKCLLLSIKHFLRGERFLHASVLLSVCLSVCQFARLPFSVRTALLLALAMPLPGHPATAPHWVSTQLPERGGPWFALHLNYFRLQCFTLPQREKWKSGGKSAGPHMHNFMLTTVTWVSFSLP